MRFIQNRSPQAGNALLVVSAAIAFSLISALIILGIDTLTVKVRSTRLYLATSDISRRLTAQALRQGELVKSFAIELNQLQRSGQLGSGVEITEAILIAPVMPEDFSYRETSGEMGLWAAPPQSFSTRAAYESELLSNLSHDFFDKGSSYRPRPPFCAPGSSTPTDPACKRITFTQLSVANNSGTRCYLFDKTTGQHDKDCLFQGYSSSLVLDDQNNAYIINDQSAPIPMGVLSNLQNAGNTVGVYLTMRTNTWLSGARELSAISLYRTLPRGINSSAQVPGIPASLPRPTGAYHTAATTPGLFIAVAPQLEIPDVTNPNNMQFTYAQFPKAYTLGLDPLEALKVTSMQVTTPFGAQAVDQGAGADSDAGQPFIVKSPQKSDDLTEVKAFAAGCSNPVAQMRNAFVSTLLEIAARDGNLRAGVEFLLVNSLANYRLKSTDGEIPQCNSTGTSLGTCSWPTIITRKGEDIAKNIFQIPYTTMNFGQNDSAPVRGGFTYAVEPPALVIDNTPAAIRARHYRFASQLRSCYNLYAPRFGTSMSSPVLQRYTLGIDEVSFNPFLPASTYPLPSQQPYSSSPFNPAVGESWDQQCPFGTNASCVKTYSLGGLTASQVAGAMGTVQLCPLRSSGETSCPRLDHYDPGDAAFANRLRPDFVALLRYINAGINANSPLAAAIKPPGMWPIGSVQTSGTGLDNLFTFSDLRGSGDYRYLAKMPSSSLMNLVLVSHLPPADNSVELTELAQQINIFNHAGMGANAPLMLRVIVAYFPASSDDAKAEVIQRWEAVLSIAAAQQGQDAAFNRLLVFSPYNSKFSGSGYGWTTPGIDDADRFGEYWRDHLLAASDSTYGNKDLIRSYADSDVPVRRAEETYYEILNEVGNLL